MVGVLGINLKSWVNYENKIVNKVIVVGGGELGIVCILVILVKGIVDRLVFLDFLEGIKGVMMDFEIFNFFNVEISKDLFVFVYFKVVIFIVNFLGSF